MIKGIIKNKWFIAGVLVVVAAVVVTCSTVPITGRKQLNLIPDSEMMSMSFSEYDTFLKENKLSTNKEQTEMVKRVGSKIANAVEIYLKEKGLSSRIKDFKWEFNLVEDATPNAWCMPGGKVVFYTGILPICQDETGVAVVMGHEIAHAIAKHGSERMSQQLGVEAGTMALSAFMNEKPQQTQQIFATVYGVATQVGVLLPYSRKHESEADQMGLIFMAIAGYDPSAAVDFWTRMSAQGSSSTPAFLSTHPSDANRIQAIKRELPEALKYYKQ